MKEKIKSLLCAALLCISLFSVIPLSGCADAPTGDAEITFTDALGREVGVNKNPRRVAALLGSFADIWKLSGGELCAAPTDADDDFGIDMTGVVDIGGAHSPNLELILCASPELVLASASTASHVDLLEGLTAAGITVAFFDVDNFDDYISMLDICTDITERKDLFAEHGGAERERIDAVKSRYAEWVAKNGGEPVLLLRASSGFVKAKGSTGTVLGEMLADFGCVNIADSDGALTENLSVESVIKSSPRRIFVVAMGDESAALASFENMIKENPAWGTLEAIGEGRVYFMDKALFNQKPNSRWAEAYELLYEKLTEK